MEKNKKPEAHKQDESERDDVNWYVVLPMLIVMGAIILYVIFI